MLCSVLPARLDYPDAGTETLKPFDLCPRVVIWRASKAVASSAEIYSSALGMIRGAYSSSQTRQPKSARIEAI